MSLKLFRDICGGVLVYLCANLYVTECVVISDFCLSLLYLQTLLDSLPAGSEESTKTVFMFRTWEFNFHGNLL